ncbi:ethanolamine utilization dehydrogenase [Citrobacter freundii]|nr:ethanolamine utilization dehydrogenase [Citrobacter freundii]
MQAELQTALFQAFDTLNLQRVKTFSVPPVTLCGLGALSTCGQEAQTRGLTHMFVMVDSFLHQAGMTAALERSLAMKGVAMTLWPCPVGEPCITDVCAASRNCVNRSAMALWPLVVAPYSMPPRQWRCW